MKGLIHRYRDYLPIKEEAIVTLYEGNTPLLPAPRLSAKIHKNLKIYLKFEGLNPTGSFKDRGMTYAVSKAKEEGAKILMCASTGNTSASAAAYAARAGMRAIVLIPEGKIALGKLTQAIIHGATVVQIRGNFDEALLLVKEIAGEKPVVIVNSINPYRLIGQRTAAYEVCEELGRAPDYHALPVGNAGNITAYWAGYKVYHEEKKISKLPKMLGFQAAGAAPIVLGKPVLNPETLATAIRIGNPTSWKGALATVEESGGAIDKVTDEEVVEAYQLVARTEGYFCEPSSAAGIAGVIQCAKRGYFKEEGLVVCTLTGHGLKDPDTALRFGEKPVSLAPNKQKICEYLKL